MIRALGIFILSVFFLHSASAKEERIKFDLKFGFVKGGEAEFIIRDTLFNGQPAIHYYVIGRTTGLANSLYGVNDIYETIVDAKTHLPLKSIRNIKEGKYRWYNETLYYQDVDSIYSQKSGGRSVPDDLLDIISAWFYFINHNTVEKMSSGDAVTYPTFHADKISDVMIKYLRDEEIKTPIGDINCFVVAPVVDKGKLLNRSDGLRFYVSKDFNVPVLLEFDMKVGALRAVLQSYSIDGREQNTK